MLYCSRNTNPSFSLRMVDGLEIRTSAEVSFASTDRSLSSQAYSLLIDSIIHGKLEPGSVYSISAIAAKFKGSRTPIHAACQRLECEGFLRILPKQGILIEPITIDVAREAYEMRAAIESFMFKRSCHFFESADVEFLEKSCTKQATFVEANDVAGFMDEDIRFHKYMISKYINIQAFSLLDTLYIRSLQIGIQCIKLPGRLISSYKEHVNIIENIKNGNFDAAQQAIEINVLNGYYNLSKNYGIDRDLT